MSIEKLISFHIEKQFPAIYREDGPELVEFVKEYYKFLQTSTNQSIYNGRRLFEYRDIDTTLESMLLFFKNKFLADLPFNEDTVRIVVKNILGLYRRKGTQDGLELFFRIFYNEEIKVYYPAKDILKPSDSEWKTGSYLQMIPNDGLFTSTRTDDTYTYKDIVGKTIVGAASRVKAIVDKINFIVLNNTLIPIIFINGATGNFIGLEGIICEINGIPINFGTIQGSLTSIEIDTNFNGTTGNEIGDIVTFRTDPDGIGGRGIVTRVTESATGRVKYTVEDGGWGYSIGSTKLLVSDQIIFLDNTGGKFEVLEALEDSSGNRGIVIGQNEISIGVKMDFGDEFSNTSIITTVDRDVNVTLSSLSGLTPVRVIEKNSSSPGQLFPETGNTAHVILSDISNEETVSLIFDRISDYLNVSLDSSNYNDPPALKPMSGGISPINIDTRLVDAFDLTPVQIGTIVTFDNINPGIDYVNDVFALAYDDRLASFQRKNQLITLELIPATLSIGSEITQNGIGGKVVSIQDKTITVRPYAYNGFNSVTPIIFDGLSLNIVSLSIDYSSKVLGFNASIDTITEFASGRIVSVDVTDSGYGYAHNLIADVLDANENVIARGTVSARKQGTTGGYWSSLDSHLNGYVNKNGNLTYFNSGKCIQDSLYYQEYSYEVQTKLGIEQYEDSLKEIAHVAGTKVFGKFNLEETMSTPISSRVQIVT